GNGNGTFQAQATFATGSGPRSVAAGDFNADGRSDLEGANGSSSSISVLLNNGKGDFTGQVYNILSGPPLVQSINRTTPATVTALTPSVVFTVTFNQPVGGVDATDFQVAATGTVTTSPALAVAGGGTVYTVTVGGITGEGTLRLNLVDDDSIRNDLTEPVSGAGLG